MVKEYRPKPKVVRAMLFDGTDESYAALVELVGEDKVQQRVHLGVVFASGETVSAGNYVVVAPTKTGMHGFTISPAEFADEYEPVEAVPEKPARKEKR